MEAQQAYAKCLATTLRRDGPKLGKTFPEPVAPPLPTVKWVSTGKPVVGGKRSAEEGGEGAPSTKRRRNASGEGRPALRDRLQRRLEEERAKGQVKRDKEKEKNDKMQERLREKIDREREKERLRLERVKQKEMEMREKLMIKLQKEREKEQARLEREEMRKKKAMEKIREKEERELQRLKEREKKEKEREILKQQKDAERAAAANVMKAARGDEVIRKQALDLPDDEDIERDELAKKLMEQGANTDENGRPVPMRVQLPPFPPKDVEMKTVIPGWESDLPTLLQCCSFLYVFRGMVGIMPPSMKELAEAVEAGTDSQLLSTIHVSLLQLLQFNLESAQGVSGVAHAADASAASAALLEEVWAWGFDLDTWRAHLNGLTWPEVMRQLAIAAGLGPDRPQPEEVHEEDENLQCPPLGAGLSLPARLKLGSVKACAFIVLSHAGPEGLSVTEIAEQVEAQKLRDFSTTRTPEASIAAALSKDVLFRRLSPTQFALQTLAANHRKATNGSVEMEEEDAEKDQTSEEQGEDHGRKKDAKEPGGKIERGEVEEGAFKKEWVKVLSLSNYSKLARSQRLEALAWLCDLLTEQKSSRDHLDAQIDKVVQTKKKLHEKFQEEKRRTKEQELLKAQLMLLKSSVEEGEGEEEKKTDMERLQKEIDGVKAIIDKNKEDIADLRKKLMKCTSRQKSLGRDRRNNRYWIFNQNRANASRCGSYDLGCIYQEPAAPDEASTTGAWRAICTETSYNAFSGALNPKGRRECVLLGSLKKFDRNIKEAMMLQSLNFGINDQADHVLTAPVPAEVNLGNPQYKSLRDWLYAVETVASVVLKEQKKKSRGNFSGLACSSGDDLFFTKLRNDFSDILQASLPTMAKKNAADRDWHGELEAADTPLKLRKLIGDFEGSLRSSDSFSPTFKRVPTVAEDVLESLIVEGISDPHGGTDVGTEAFANLSWVPPTNAGLAMRLLSLDAALRYRGKKALRDVSDAYRFIFNPMLAPNQQHASSDEEGADGKQASDANDEGDSSDGSSDSDEGEEAESEDTQESDTDDESD
eukprot:scaffold24_cov341-Pavlova_lutheri.AAC.62